MRFKHLLSTVSLLLLVFVLSVAVSAAPLKIGVSAPLTGASAFMGYSARDGAQLAVAAINKAGSVNGSKVELLLEDDRVTPAEGVNIAEKYITRDKVSVLLYTVGSAVSLAALPVADRYQVPLFSLGTADGITAGDSQWVFNNVATNSMIAEQSVKYIALKVKPRPKSAAIIYENTDYGVELKDYTTSYLRKYNIRVVGAETHLQGAVDFRAQLTKLAEAKPEVVFIWNKYTEGAQIVRQARDLGFNPIIVGSNGHAVEEFIKLGGKSVEGVFIPSLFETTSSNSKAQQFVKDFQKAYGKDPDWFAAAAYDAVFTIVDAAKKAKSNDPKALRAALAKTKDLNLVFGPTTFDENGRAKSKVLITKIQDGKRVIQEN